MESANCLSGRQTGCPDMSVRCLCVSAMQPSNSFNWTYMERSRWRCRAFRPPRTASGSLLWRCRLRLLNHLCEVWQQPDQGIWETRDGPQHFTHSKVMAWVALDRAIKHFERVDGDREMKRWKRVRARIHKEVCEKGFNKRLNSFVQSYGSNATRRVVPPNRVGGISSAGRPEDSSEQWRRLRST